MYVVIFSGVLRQPEIVGELSAHTPALSNDSVLGYNRRRVCCRGYYKTHNWRCVCKCFVSHPDRLGPHICKTLFPLSTNHSEDQKSRIQGTGGLNYIVLLADCNCITTSDEEARIVEVGSSHSKTIWSVHGSHSVHSYCIFLLVPFCLHLSDSPRLQPGFQ